MWQVSCLCFFFFLILLCGVWSWLFVCNIFYCLISLSKSVCFFVLVRSATSDSIERMVLWRRCPVGPNCHHSQVLQECSFSLCWLCVPFCCVYAMTTVGALFNRAACRSTVGEACVQLLVASWCVSLPPAWLSVGPAVTAASMLMGWANDSVCLAARPVCDYYRYTGMWVTCPAWLAAGLLHDSCWYSDMECRPLFWLAVRPGLYFCKCTGVQRVIAPTWGTTLEGDLRPPKTFPCSGSGPPPWMGSRLYGITYWLLRDGAPPWKSSTSSQDTWQLLGAG